MAPSKPAPLAESWEDDNAPDPTAADSINPLGRPNTFEGPGAPPPTPASPRAAQKANEPPSFDALLHPSQQFQPPRGLQPNSASSERRPEKTTATASRLIAAGLGIKAPKRSEEQRQYDKALRDRERQARDDRREAERRDVQERDKARQAMWDD